MESQQTVASVPQIFIKVVKAEGIRPHKGRDPTPSMLIRVSVAGEAQPQVLKTKPMNPGTDPSWNQEFMLPVPDPSAAQLECTIWDESDHQPQGYANFLGEVLLNLARLAPYKGHYIEQLFYIKQGKTIVTEEQASGNLKLGLRLDIPDDYSTPSRAPAAPVQSSIASEQDSSVAERNAQEARKVAAERQQAQEEEAQRMAEQQRQAAEKQKEAQRIAAAQEAERAAEMQRQAQAAEAQRAAEEQQRQKELAERKAQEQEEHARMRAQEQEMAKRAAQHAPTSRTASPPPAGSPLPPSPPVERPAQARIVIAVIEANELPEIDNVNPQAKITLQGPASLSTVQTRLLKNTREPLWNEKFVFGVEDESKDTTYICAEIISMPNESDTVKLGAIQPVPVSTLMSGQKMSLPTVNQGNHIFCIDGWFEIFSQSPTSSFAAMTPTKTAGKSQIHLRMTFIPSAGTSETPTPAPVSLPVPPPVATPPPAETQAISSPSAQVAVSTAPHLPMEPKLKSDIPALPSAVQEFSPRQPRVLEHQEAPPRRLERERTPLPIKGGPADVGIVLKGGNPDGSLLVDEIILGSPATEGLQIGRGDALIDVDGYDVVGRPVEDAQGLLRGPPNSPVTMILQRGGKGGEPIVVTLLRAIPTVGIAVHPAQSPMQTRARAPLPSQAAAVGTSTVEAPLPSAHVPLPSADPTEMRKALCAEFQNIAFLWSDREQQDPVVTALVEWKDDLLCEKMPRLLECARFRHLRQSSLFIRCDTSRWRPTNSFNLWLPATCGPWYPSMAMSSSFFSAPSYPAADPLAQTAPQSSGDGRAVAMADWHQAAA